MENKKAAESTGIESTNDLLLNTIKLCEKYYNQIDKKLRQLAEYRNCESSLNQNLDNSTELKDLELQFWNDLKSFKDANEPIVIQYIIGVYVKLHQITLLYFNLSKKNDVYFIHSIGIRTCERNETEFLYNLYIHLGDLNRYQKSNKLAKQFYLKARSLNPNNGQSYNQLALIYGSQDAIKSIYFYVRAYLAVEPSKIAFNNLRLSVKHYMNTNQLIKLLFDSTTTKIDKIKVENWLFLVVIAIFADSVNTIAQYLFDDLNYWFKFKIISFSSSLAHELKDETDYKFLFSSFDLFLDYCLNYGSIGQQDNNLDLNSSKSTNLNPNPFSTKFNLIDQEKKLKEFKQIIDSYSQKVNLNCLSLEPIALRHDFILQGLNLLENQHSNLIFTDKNGKYANNLNRLICRINLKLDQVINLIDKKVKQTKTTQKKMRNVALQSILNANN